MRLAALTIVARGSTQRQTARGPQEGRATGFHEIGAGGDDRDDSRFRDVSANGVAFGNPSGPATQPHGAITLEAGGAGAHVTPVATGSSR